MAPEETEPQTMTSSARAKLQDVWSSLRSITVDGDDMDGKGSSILGKWPPRSASSDENDGGTTLENVVRSMFGSCTAFADADETVQESNTSVRRRDRSKSSSRRRGSSSASARAQQAVDNLREKAEQRETSPSQRRASSSRPFPASDPNSNRRQVKQDVPYLVHEIGPPPPPPNVTDLGAGASTFDDGISAISAHTLEELHREQSKLKNPLQFNAVPSDLTQEEGVEQAGKKNLSNDSSLFPQPDAGEERDCMTGPVDFSRERSNNTWGTHGSRRTFQSMSTQSTDFEKVFRQEEQKYWNETVQDDETKLKGSVARRLNLMNSRGMRVRSGSREQETTLKHDGTNTTAGSSGFSGMSSSPQHSQHPHDTLVLDPSDYVPVRSPRRVLHDPDRIEEFMPIDATTEIGEI